MPQSVGNAGNRDPVLCPSPWHRAAARDSDKQPRTYRRRRASTEFVCLLVCPDKTLAFQSAHMPRQENYTSRRRGPVCRNTTYMTAQNSKNASHSQKKRPRSQYSPPFLAALVRGQYSGAIIYLKDCNRTPLCSRAPRRERGTSRCFRFVQDPIAEN